MIRKLRRYFRADAAFAAPDIYEFLKKEGFSYGLRLKADTAFQDNIGRLLKRPVGRPPNEVRRTYASLRYQAGIGTGSVASWPSSSGTLASFTLVSASS